MGVLQPQLLVVEDEFMIGAEIGALAQDAGYQARVVPSLAQADEVLKDEPVVGAILDFRVADGRSGALAKHLQALNIPYVVVSGSPRSELTMAGIDEERIFHKPADYSRVIKTLCQRFGMLQVV